MEIATERSHTPKGKSTRDRILMVAEALFADHGIHGTRMRDIAAAAGLPLASTIYHFAKKEQLYKQVLEGIASELLHELDVAVGPARIKGDLVERFVAPVDALAISLVRWSQKNPSRVRLMLRELLDNPTRVARAAKLPLTPFLERAAAMVTSGQRAGVLESRTPETAVLHVVGGLHYTISANPTLRRMVGVKRAEAIAETYQREAIAFARHTLGVPAAYARLKDAHHAS